MKTKFFEVTIGGYYLCSFVLGVLVYWLALLVPHAVDSWVYEEYDVDVSNFLPSTRLYDLLYIDGMEYAPLLAAVLAIAFVMLTVNMMEGKGMSKAWRTKALQAAGFAGAMICVDLTFNYAFLVIYCPVNPLVMFIPVVILVVPLMVLMKTRQRTAAKALDVCHSEKK